MKGYKKYLSVIKTKEKDGRVYYIGYCRMMFRSYVLCDGDLLGVNSRWNVRMSRYANRYNCVSDLRRAFIHHYRLRKNKLIVEKVWP